MNTTPEEYSGRTYGLHEAMNSEAHKAVVGLRKTDPVETENEPAPLSANEKKKLVWEFLEKMKPGTRYKISSLRADWDKYEFIEHAKAWMRCWPYNGWVSFNANYTEIYKTHGI